MQVQYLWMVLAVILLLAEIWAIRSVLRSGARAENKGLWVVVIIFMPLLGLLLWLVAGPKALNRDTPAERGRS